MGRRPPLPDCRVHACLYFIPPSGHGLRHPGHTDLLTQLNRHMTRWTSHNTEYFSLAKSICFLIFYLKLWKFFLAAQLAHLWFFDTILFSIRLHLMKISIVYLKRRCSLPLQRVHEIKHTYLVFHTHGLFITWKPSSG